jgi:hypothetical protein
MLWLESTCYIRFPFPSTTGGVSGLLIIGGKNSVHTSIHLYLWPNFDSEKGEVYLLVVHFVLWQTSDQKYPIFA